MDSITTFCISHLENYSLFSCLCHLADLIAYLRSSTFYLKRQKLYWGYCAFSRTWLVEVVMLQVWYAKRLRWWFPTLILPPIWKYT